MSIFDAIKDLMSGQEPYEALLQLLMEKHGTLDGYAAWSDDDVRDAVKFLYPDMSDEDVDFMAKEAMEAWTSA